MADKNINIKIKADSKDAQKGINSVTSSLNKLAKDVQKHPITKMSKSITSLGFAFKFATSAISKTIGAVKDLESASLKQIKAEKQLETAAKNNPYLNKSAVSNLKKFASELQNIGTIGDEELLPMMAQLAAAGRTQEQIQSIMSAALDVSASGAMSLESAVDALNKSLNGQGKSLATLNPQVKTLTEEELRQGKAIELVAKNFKGISQETTAATGSAEQLKNAWGDLKENLGFKFLPVLEGIRKKTLEIVNTINSAMGAQKSYKEASANMANGNASTADIDTLIEAANKRIARSEGLKKGMRKAVIDDLNKSIEEERKYIAELENQIKAILEAEDAQKKAAEANAAAIEIKEKELSNDQKVLAIQKKYNDELEKVKQNIAYRRQAGQNISEEAAQQELLNAKINAYVEAREEAGSLMSDNNSWVKTTIADIEASASVLENSLVPEIELAQDERSKLVQDWMQSNKSEVEALKEQLQTLKEYKADLEDIGANWGDVEQAIKNCEAAINQANFDSFMSNIQSVMDTVTSSMQNLGNTINSISQTALSATQRETDNKTDKLKTQLDQGIIDYETYYEKKDELDKQAARKEYKIKMAQWQMNMAIASAQAAQAVVNALATGTPPLNIINATAAGLLGAAQIVAMAGSKPVAPSFATGGIVPGQSYSGDNVQANVNSGEMILNAMQQKQLWAMANGANGGGINLSMPINIENNAGDSVQVSAAQQNREIKITVDKIVKTGLSNGSYNSQLQTANNSMTGAKYL